MEYVLILASSVGVGVLVYRLSVRVGGASRSSSAGAVAEGYNDAPAGPSAGPTAPGTAYLPVSTSEPSWQSRLIGLLGLVLMVAAAGTLLAIALYQAGALIARLLSHAAESGTAAGLILSASLRRPRASCPGAPGPRATRASRRRADAPRG